MRRKPRQASVILIGARETRVAELPQWPMKIAALAVAALGFMPELACLGIGIWLLTIGWTVTGGALSRLRSCSVFFSGV